MASDNVYCHLDDLKASLFSGNPSPGSDGRLSQAIETSSRAIDEHCNRRFFIVPGEVRSYTARSSVLVIPDHDDLLAVTSVKTDEDGDGTYEITWSASTDYRLAPVNNAQLGKPYWQILRRPNARYSFPRRDFGVEVTGSFGFCAITAVPAQVRECCIEQATRLFKRKDAPFGIQVFGDAGAARISKVDPDLQWLLDPFVLAVIG